MVHLGGHLHVYELFVKDILTLSGPINVNKAGLYFLGILVCEALQCRSDAIIIFDSVDSA